MIRPRYMELRNNLVIIAFTAIFFGQFQSANATRYYVDPVNGDMADDGSLENPWKTLAEVFSQNKTFEAGDTIFLLSGHHGIITVKGINSAYVTILPLEGHLPTMKKLSFNSAKKWKLLGASISPETAPSYSRTTLLEIPSSASEIIIDSCYVYSVEDNSPWSASDWVSKSCSGVNIDGSDNIIRNNHFFNVDHGISVSGQNNLIVNNVVENFAGDGIRGIGDYNTYEYNTVKDCYDVDDNHDDGFQSWSTGAGGIGTGTVYGVVIRGNTIINYTDTDRPFIGSLQGMGCFDGMFEDWTVENNVVITDHWHGITLMGAINCNIVNNTVVDRNSTAPGPPWIRISKHKNGTLGTGNVIRNNLTTALSNDEGIGVVNFNIIVQNYDDYFYHYENFDLRLIEGCAAIDAGTTTGAPHYDIDGLPRPQGSGIDVGAYEYPGGIDSVSPELLSITIINPAVIELFFSERLKISYAQNIENYSIDNGIAISEALLSENKREVTLAISELGESMIYMLTVINIQDLAGNVIEPGSTMIPAVPLNKFSDIPYYGFFSNYTVNTSSVWEVFEEEEDIIVGMYEYGSASGQYMLINDSIFRHFDISFDARSIEGSNPNDIMVVFGYQDKDNYSYIKLSSQINESGAFVRIGGVSTNIWLLDDFETYGVQDNEWTHYRMEALDSVIIIYRNDEELFKVTPQVELFYEGGLGVGTYFRNRAYFDDIELTRLHSTVGIEDNPGVQFRIFPNPFDHTIFIDSPDEFYIQKIQLIGLLGQTLAFPGFTNMTTLDVEKVVPGIYILQIHTDQGIINRRIIKN